MSDIEENFFLNEQQIKNLTKKEKAGAPKQVPEKLIVSKDNIIKYLEQLNPAFFSFSKDANNDKCLSVRVDEFYGLIKQEIDDNSNDWDYMYVIYLNNIRYTKRNKKTRKAVKALLRKNIKKLKNYIRKRLKKNLKGF